MLSVVQALLQEALEVDPEVVQYCTESLAALDSKSKDDVLAVIGPFAEGLGLSSQRVTVLCQQLAAAFLRADEGTELNIGAESTPVAQPNVKTGTRVAADASELAVMAPEAASRPAVQQMDDDGFQTPKKTVRRTRAVRTQRSEVIEKPLKTMVSGQLPRQTSPRSNSQQLICNSNEPVRQRSSATDIASALSVYSSRKHLRRFAAQLGLQADDPTGMAALLALDTTTVETALVATVPDDASRSALSAFLEQLAADGLPDCVVQHPDTIVEQPKAADAHHHGKKCAPLHCCVECHLRCAARQRTRARTPLCPPNYIHTSAVTVINRRIDISSVAERCSCCGVAWQDPVCIQAPWRMSSV